MSYTNIEMESMLESLRPMLDHSDMIGYAAARNTRILSGELTEYHDIRDELVGKHGYKETDDNGNPTGRMRLDIDSPEFDLFTKDIEQYAMVRHSPDLFMLKYEDVIGKLTGSEILSIDWMLED